jgi:hypothetical protein
MYQGEIALSASIAADIFCCDDIILGHEAACSKMRRISTVNLINNLLFHG